MAATENGMHVYGRKGGWLIGAACYNNGNGRIGKNEIIISYCEVLETNRLIQGAYSQIVLIKSVGSFGFGFE
ncbi:hypothetical protein BPA01_52230 [Brevibacillus parabrevis]|uniref:Uncharacterized protein n=1 Tax=Brevibacillus parabrevis TaxID=54914 RepID=A0A4Y3PQF3_BREPA|nr:hypothetical protein BPA01_52230 [Brevibacillus parabrevis]